MLFFNIKNDTSQQSFRNNSNKVNNTIKLNANKYKEEKDIIKETNKYLNNNRFGRNNNYITWNVQREDINLNIKKDYKKTINNATNNDKDKNRDEPLIKNSIRNKYKRRNID